MSDRPAPRPSRRYWGRRRRRLRRTLVVLVAVGAAGVVAGFLAYRLSRPQVRRPGEELPEITRKLARDLPPDAPEPRFTDVTVEAGLGEFRTFAGERTSQLPEDMGSGVAWGDFDNDGDDDLFLVAAGGAMSLAAEEWAPSELYENLGDGRFHRVEDFPETRILGMGAAWGDVDGDGWLDLAVSGYGGLLLFRNREGRMVLDEEFQAPAGYWAGVSWGDFDNDRDLDLYVCGYVKYQADPARGQRMTQQYGAVVPYTLNPASFEPERNLLLQNRGDGTFDEVAELYGVSNPAGRSLTALWHDFDGDGWLDLYVANDISDNALYLNNRGETFEDAGLAAWVADYRGAMGLAAGDWNRDGDDDLFITHWVAQENALYDSRLLEMRQASPASLPPSGGQAPSGPRLTFSDLAAPLGLGQIALQFVGWGTEFADLDGDGWLDLVVANGSTLETDTEPRRLKPQPSLLLWNRRGEYFHDLAPLAELLAAPRVSRGLAVSDYDSDGDLDLLKVHLGEGVQLLRNEMQTGSWLELVLHSRGSAGRSSGRGEGATVIVRADGALLRRSVSHASYLSQSSSVVHFGLGSAARVDGVEVRWLGGEPQSFGPLEVDSRWELIEGEPTPRRFSVAGASPPGVAEAESRERLVAFWSKQRAAMDAIKRDGDIPRAIKLLREALALNPGHEDSRYYLGNCLAVQGRFDQALAEFDTLRRQNPQSHRGHKQWGVLRAMTAETTADLEAAAAALERALELNPEETGALLVLGEIALLLDRSDEAGQRLAWACRTNPRAVGGFFLRAYLAWKAGEREASGELLRAAREARGEEWKPEGAVAEGDVAARMHREVTPLSRFWERWDGAAEPTRQVFGPLDDYLTAHLSSP